MFHKIPLASFVISSKAKTTRSCALLWCFYSPDKRVQRQTAHHCIIAWAFFWSCQVRAYLTDSGARRSLAVERQFCEVIWFHVKLLQREGSGCEDGQLIRDVTGCKGTFECEGNVSEVFKKYRKCEMKSSFNIGKELLGTCYTIPTSFKLRIAASIINCVTQ